jgi:glycosyltransferase involved in cell wall biosynthesis
MLVETARFARFLRREQVALVHCHDRYSNLFGVIASRLARTPVIASKRWAEAERRHRVLNALAFRWASAVVANSNSVVHSLTHDDRVDPARVTLVPNFVDDAAFQAPDEPLRRRLVRELGVPEDGRLIGIIASLRPIKNHDILIRALALLIRDVPEAHLVVVGDGESRTSLESLAGELHVREHVTFTGVRSNAPNLHHLFEVSVLCSRTEGFPNSVVEAMAAGRPVVGTDVVGIRDAVSHEETGLLVPPGDPAALAAALRRLLSDRGLARRMGEHGRTRARQSFHSAAALAPLETLYHRLTTREP